MDTHAGTPLASILVVAIRKILCAVDGSDSAGRAARFAAELAADLGARVRLVYVFDAPAIAELGMVAKGDIEETKDFVSATSFEAALRSIGELDVRPEQHVEIGHPADEVVDLAGRGGFDLIVMGCRGRSPARQLLTGSVSERVVRSAPCPVVLVR